MVVLFVAVAIASSLYMLAEFAEEYPSLAGKVIQYTLAAVVCFHGILLLDELPYYEVIVGLISHGTYFTTLRTFPFIKVVSVSSLLSLVSFFVSNITWLQYFVRIRSGGPEFVQVIGFFFVMVWLTPISLFISLCLSENILPMGANGDFDATSNGLDLSSASDGKKKTIIRVIIDYLMQIILEPLKVAILTSIQASVKFVSTKKDA